ncbi:hypothetical protein [Pseudoxanthomonas sp. CF125]|uniref:hypothetical protein n=1 Tax=Pseudoxanthomonas sp. CF125 TaxID=1855303 RepID=UPI0008879AC9|nr:hypothetical protein [Pseudoxanthomonas sp. CF125]SDQ42712.1 hypothetical protein SAMN05216569_1083 [Pseudoxanthomonas sp. CF125]
MKRSQRGDAEVFLIFLAFGLFVAVTVGLTMYGEAYSCSKRAGLMGLRHSWGPMQGCMVQVGQRYSPIEYIRIVDDKVIIQGDGG